MEARERMRIRCTAIPRGGHVSMTWHLNTRHTVPLGKTSEEFDERTMVYGSYWTMTEDGTPYSNVTGGGRPFWAVCIKCGQEMEKVPAVVGVSCDKYHDDMPVMGWCACICCKRCVDGMPLIDLEWKACPMCRDEHAHQQDYLMYPLTEEGREYNVHLEQAYTTERRKRYVHMSWRVGTSWKTKQKFLTLIVLCLIDVAHTQTFAEEGNDFGRSICRGE
jgi:hypothetical protein